MRKIKVGFTGTHGTGKTTTCYDLATQIKKMGKDVNIITNTARSSPLPKNEQATVQSQNWIFSELIRRESESKAEVTIGDRTILDVWAYMRRVSVDDAVVLLPFVQRYMKTYDIVFYAEPRKGYLKKDGVRSVNQKFQDEIKLILDSTIETLGIEINRAKSKKGRVSAVELILMSLEEKNE